MCAPSRGRLRHGVRYGNTFRGSWPRSCAIGKLDGSTEPEGALMDRRTFLAGTGAVLFFTPLAAEGQQPGKAYRVGILVIANRRVYDPFVAELHKLGYIDGQNLVLEFRSAEGNVERLPALAVELVRAGVDVILSA